MHLFARFGDLLPNVVQNWLNESRTIERCRSPSTEFVELTLMPTGTRLANVSLRLPLLEREANCGVSAGVPPTGVIRLDDLIVGTQNGRLYVRRSSSDQRLVFSSNSMLNTTRAPRECRILLALALDPVAQLTVFRWGSVANGVFLPRVTSGRVILHCAQWRLRTAAASMERTAVAHRSVLFRAKPLRKIDRAMPGLP
jgi:lantibiotic biosynthesis protein